MAHGILDLLNKISVKRQPTEECRISRISLEPQCTTSVTTKTP